MQKDGGLVGRRGGCWFIMLQGCNMKRIFVDVINFNGFIVIVREIGIYFDCDIIIVIIRDSGQLKVGKYKVKLL